MACQTISLTLAASSCAITITGFATFQLVCPLHTTINLRYHPVEYRDHCTIGLYMTESCDDKPISTCQPDSFPLAPRI